MDEPIVLIGGGNELGSATADGDIWRMPLSQECIFGYPLEARLEDGSLIAVLEEEYCDDQTWTIRGVGDTTLE